MDPSNKDTKILCTIGPASLEVPMLRRMVANGMNAVRINTAHEKFRYYKRIIDNVRQVDDLPIVLDIKGPELRIRISEDKTIKKGAKVKVGFSDKHEIHLSQNILDRLHKGDYILVHDGKYKFRVDSKGKDFILMSSDEETKIEPNKNVNVPNKSLNLPQLNPKDYEGIRFAKKEKLDYIALSFCRNKHDVFNLRNLLGNSGIKIIAKIENKEGVDNIHDIIDASDGIMVARGDMGVELPAEQVPMIQKMLIKACNEKGKLVIVATQMLESMCENSTPTRAEVSDVANAILDGADCIMLSEETALGKYPAEAVMTMSKVALQVEPKTKSNVTQSDAGNTSETISHSVYQLAQTLPITKIICLTYSGHTATKIARFRLDTPIYAITSSEQVARQLKLYYSIRPIFYKTDFWRVPIITTAKYLFKNRIIHKDDLLLFTAGLYSLEGKKTNAIQIHKVSDLIHYIKKNRQ